MLLNFFIFIVMVMIVVIFRAHASESFEDELVQQLDQYSMQLSFALRALVHVGSAAYAAVAFMQVERPKLVSMGALASRQGGTVFSTQSRYTMTQGDAFAFFGDFAACRQATAATAAEADQTFWARTWYSEDFYGGHGTEYVSVSVLCDEAGQLNLMARKVTGDPNVPCGRITWRTKGGIPVIGGPGVPFEMQVRDDINDVNAFHWISGTEVWAVSINEISAVMEDDWEGTFHRQDPVEDPAGKDTGRQGADGNHRPDSDKTPLIEHRSE